MKQLKTPELAKEISRVKIDFALQLNNLMLDKNINQTELSEKSGKSKSLISRILCGDNNLTMETMVELYHALDEVLIISTKKSILNDFMLLTSRRTYSHTDHCEKVNITTNNSMFISKTNKNQGTQNSSFFDTLKKIHENSISHFPNK